MMNYGIFLERLRETRIRKGFSLRKIGEAMGISGQQVSLFERGKTPLKVKDYFLICNILKISPRELIDGDVSLGEYSGVAEQLRNLSERDFRIIKDLIMLMELQKGDL